MKELVVTLYFPYRGDLIGEQAQVVVDNILRNRDGPVDQLLEGLRWVFPDAGWEGCERGKATLQERVHE